MLSSYTHNTRPLYMIVAVYGQELMPYGRFDPLEIFIAQH